MSQDSCYPIRFRVSTAALALANLRNTFRFCCGGSANLGPSTSSGTIQKPALLSPAAAVWKWVQSESATESRELQQSDVKTTVKKTATSKYIIRINYTLTPHRGLDVTLAAARIRLWRILPSLTRKIVHCRGLSGRLVFATAPDLRAVH